MQKLSEKETLNVLQRSIDNAEVLLADILSAVKVKYRVRKLSISEMDIEEKRITFEKGARDDVQVVLYKIPLTSYTANDVSVSLPHTEEKSPSPSDVVLKTGALPIEVYYDGQRDMSQSEYVFVL